MSKTKVLIIDDSALIRMAFKELLSENDGIEVVATARDPIDAEKKIERYQPDVLTLDIEMPKMDGISFLQKIMKEKPMPVVMISSLTQEGADATLKALELGAVDYMSKNTSSSFDSDIFKTELVKKVKIAAKANIKRLQAKTSGQASASSSKPVANLEAPQTKKVDLIAIGSSTGGVETFSRLIKNLPFGLPPIIITQHMPVPYTSYFARRIDGIFPHKILEARTGEILKKGHIYIANGDNHLTIQKRGANLMIENKNSPPVSSHRPSVDVMFNSVASVCGARAIGVILTGMGQDGAAGMLAMKRAGCFTIGQSEESCVVYGMPRAAKNFDAVVKEMALEKMPKEIVNYLS